MFVGMLPKKFTEADLDKLFSPYGELKEVSVESFPSFKVFDILCSDTYH